MSNSWPEGVPESLWNYGRMQIQDLPQVPMMGVGFSNQFKLAFAAGFLFVGYVAWKRFTTVQSEADGFRYRVMREVGVADLGGTSALRRAYFIYLTTMLALYVVFTFFGKLIVQTVNGLNVVGIQVDSSSLEFDSPQWPLLLAFGFAGLAPLIPQLRGAENWLFRRAYRAVGIPVRIDQTTRNLLDLLAGGKADASGKMARELDERRKKLGKKIEGTWIHDTLSVREAKLRSALGVLAELELLVDLTRGGRGPWPGSHVSNALRDVEQKIAGQAGELFDEFDARVHDAVVQRTVAARTWADPADSAEPPTDHQAKYLAKTLSEARVLRDELVAVLAVYVERDPDYLETLPDGSKRDRIRHEGLRQLLQQADPPNLAGSGPELGVLVFIGLCIPVYMLFTWEGLHPLLSPRASVTSLQAVVATTLLETLRLLSIFWFPLLGAFGLRQAYCDNDVWVAERTRNPSSYAEQRLTALTLAFGLAALCLVGLAALWAFFIARDVTAFRNNLVEGSPSFLLFYPTMAVISLPVVWHSLAGADARALIPSLPEDGARLQHSRVVVRGIWCGLLVAALQGAHIWFWWDSRACTDTGPFLIDIYFRGCFSYYGGLDFVTMPLLAFLCVVMFGKPYPVAVAPRTGHAAGTTHAEALVEGAAAAALVLLVAGATATTALAQGAAGQNDVVTIGFRSDAEPFSYRTSQTAGEGRSTDRLYKGFLADLCYWIFDGSRFSVREKEVTAANRFEKLGHEIDVLCDPVTMRFSDKRTEAGIYSPIVFATGISYLRRPSRGRWQTIYVGYVDTTTATRVAEHACRIDLFNIVDVDQRPQIARMCETAVVVRDLEEAIRLKKVLDRALLRRAKEAANEEKKIAEERREAAGVKKKPGYDLAAKRWSGALEYLVDCGADCDAQRIADDFGDLCPRDDAESPSGQDAERTAEEAPATLYRFCPKDDHTALIKWFCKRRDDAPPMVYLGDREIIVGKLQTWNEHQPFRCEVESETAAANLTYEPYALMTARIRTEDKIEREGRMIVRQGDTVGQARRREEITRLVQQRIYEFFSFRTLARAKFDAYFRGPRDDWTMSTPLAYLFVLNGTEEERLFTFPFDDSTTAASDDAAAN